MFRRILFIGVVVLAAGTVALSPAAAQDGGGGNYGGCNASVSDTNVQPGQTVTVTGSGATVDGAVVATIGEDEVGSGTADAEGNFSFDATIPSGASGNQTLSVSCGPNRGVADLVLGVGSDQLPATGSSSTVPMTQIALAALVVGAGALGAARLRTHASGRNSL